jgi:hypothetical protein
MHDVFNESWYANNGTQASGSIGTARRTRRFLDDRNCAVRRTVIDDLTNQQMPYEKASGNNTICERDILNGIQKVTDGSTCTL